MITPLHALKDNYIWIFSDETTRLAWVIDPGDASPVIHYLRKNNLDLAGVLLTHHHHDHSGGINELLNHWKNICIYASHFSPIKHISHYVKENDEIYCSPFYFKVLEIPGHTLDHTAFYNEDILFCGDTLFSAGCGRIFEGTPAQMYHSLSKIVELPDTIKLYCGHEYTLSNLIFSQHVDPNNFFVTEKIKNANALRSHNQPTLPSTLQEEKQINPFLRCENPEIIYAVEEHFQKKMNDAIDVFAHLREWKNNFVA